MSLYGRTDSNANKTQAGLARGNGSGSVSETIVFIDAAEAVLNENASRGITGPGWWAYKTYTDGAGNTRHKAECLAFISNPDDSLDGYKYRVKITSAGGTEEVISDGAATLTFGS
ncbi:hypothetical protein Syn9311C4_168 [Synechococcus phage ACG-2014b]|uniref:Virion structural protein n=1 Tax=Synechococcus phage ACG-2014b TaxID=1493508 RepID=A0A0E3HXW4_9CAUD|nr:hypothetical protein HOQ68_gp168 [Synechococcus phage ACG-2014b]AIX39251.1 hypothetical protein Syn9311C4_168 [Synechococcus phage ACG-2014b]